MNKAIRWIQTYLVCAFPFVVGLMVWITIQYEKGAFSDQQVEQLHGFFWTALSFNLMAWFSVLALFLLLLVFNSQARDLTIKRLANVRERDEREEQITGRAARTAYMSTLSLMILTLFLSVITINIYNIPKSGAGHSKMLSLGTGFKLLDESQPKQDLKTGQKIFEYSGIPLSKPAIILVFIIWELAAFNLKARSDNSRELGGQT